jgi:hypothetical protein
MEERCIVCSTLKTLSKGLSADEERYHKMRARYRPRTVVARVCSDVLVFANARRLTPRRSINRKNFARYVRLVVIFRKAIGQ